MTQTASEPTAPAPVSRARIAFASFTGTALECYDFYLFSIAAVFVFPKLFFPSGDEATGLLASLATFGLAFVARPAGSVLFGHFGDRFGRKATLIGCLLTLGLSTVAIGLLPTYQQVGVAAPVALALLRVVQGIGVGGEWSGAVLLAAENATPGKRAWATIWPQLGSPIGLFAATGVFLFLIATPAGQGSLLTWGWRVPFLLSAVMIGIGLYVRLRLAETPVYRVAAGRGELVRAPLAVVLRHSWRNVLIGVFAMVASYAIFYLASTWVVGYGTGKVVDRSGVRGSIPYTDFLIAQMASCFAYAAAIVVSARLADRYGRRPLLLVATAAIICYGLGFGWLLDPARLTAQTVLVFMCLGLTLMGLSYAPMAALFTELFPTNVRYTGSGIAFNLSGILGASITPFLATWLVSAYGVAWVGIYLAGVALVSMAALLALRETREVDLAATGGHGSSGSVRS
jgi:MFS family permease